jgi:pimeloyl-ACP methyl ester carboxylesterase
MRYTTVSADGTPIAYWRTGTGPALVLVHGASADHTRWDGILPMLEPHATVHAMDRRGRGASGDGSAYTLSHEVADVVAVVEAVAEAAGADVDLFGHSYGAVCALEAALRTDRVRRLLIYEPAVGLLPAGLVDELEALLAADRREEVLTTMLLAVGMDPDQVALARSSPSWVGRLAAAHTIVRECRADLEYRLDPARFAALHVPTLLLVGTASPPEVIKESDALAAAMADARVVALDGEGHLATVTAPGLVAAEILRFLSR